MKVNDKGRECPAWCRVPATEHRGPCCGEERTVKAGRSIAGANAFLRAGAKEPQVSAWIYGPRAEGGRMVAHSEREAKTLARVLESAVNLTNPQLRQLATQVRVAAFEAWPEQDKETEAR
jgi:hypothetical protein